MEGAGSDENFSTRETAVREHIAKQFSSDLVPARVVVVGEWKRATVRSRVRNAGHRILIFNTLSPLSGDHVR